MTTYRYIARDEQGKEITGSLDASSLDQARLALRDRGLQVREVAAIEAEPDVPTPKPLTAADSAELANEIARVSSTNVPLAPGLRAAADESDNRRVRSALLWMATKVEQGQSLEEVIRQAGDALPSYVAGLMLAALRSSSLSDALLALVEHQRVMRSLRRSLVGSLAYPLVILVLAILIVSYIVMHITGFTENMARGFGMELPYATRMLISIRHTGIWILLAVVITIAVMISIYRVIGGRAAWQRLLSSLPLVGAFVHWSGLTDWTGLMHMLLSNGVTLPESLRLAGDGSRNANVARISRQLADDVARGRSMADILSTTSQFPMSLVPLIRWGEQKGTVAESMRIGQQALERRLLIRAQLVQSVIPPTVFILLGCVISFVVAASFMPLISLISVLS